MRPRERAVVEARHRERFVPRGFARNGAVDRQHERKEPAEEEVAGGADRIRLQAPRVDAVGGPARHVVVAPQILGDERFVGLRVTGAIGIGPELGEPVDRRPVGSVPADQLIENLGIDLAPCRRLPRQQQQSVRRLGEVEARERQHGWEALVVPPWVRASGARPVVGRRRFAPQVADPAAHFGFQAGNVIARHRVAWHTSACIHRGTYVAVGSGNNSLRIGPSSVDKLFGTYCR